MDNTRRRHDGQVAAAGRRGDHKQITVQRRGDRFAAKARQHPFDISFVIAAHCIGPDIDGGHPGGSGGNQRDTNAIKRLARHPALWAEPRSNARTHRRNNGRPAPVLFRRRSDFILHRKKPL
jgi:hypothetical protein